MTIVSVERPSDSSFVEELSYGHTLGSGSTIRPTEISWHMIVMKAAGKTKMFVVGPLTSSGVVTWEGGGELLWIKFKLGTFMPHLPAKQFLDLETTLPNASGRSFWLNGSAWEFPTYENVDTFINRLVREEILVRDPVVDTVLQGYGRDFSPRTVRHRFMQTTGLTQSHIRQAERAMLAAARLRGGASILDTVFECGYFDQPHLTRALKHWIGYTPAQVVRASSCQPAITEPVYHADYAEQLATT